MDRTINLLISLFLIIILCASVGSGQPLNYTIEALPILAGYKTILPYEINNSGHIVGRVQTADIWAGGSYMGFYWDSDNGEVIVALQMANGISSSTFTMGSDVNKDDKIGTPEAVYVLHKMVE